MTTAKARARARWDGPAGGRPIRYVIDPRGPEVIGVVADRLVAGFADGIEVLPRTEAIRAHEGAVSDWEDRLRPLMGGAELSPIGDRAVPIGTAAGERLSFDLLSAWSRFMSVNGKADRTLRAYRRTIVCFLADTAETCRGDLTAVTEEQVVGYVSALAPNGSMRGQFLRALRSFYSWATDRGHVKRNPVGQLKPKNRKYGPASSLTEDELARLIEAAAKVEPRRAWAILLMYATGARIGSLMHVMADDVKDDRIFFRVAKGDDPYSVPLGRIGRDAVAALKSWTPTDRRQVSNGTLIGVGEERFRQWLTLAEHMSGVRAHPHLIRHTYATKLARTTDPGTWMALMHHRDLSQFRRYVAVDEERLKNAVEDL